MSRTVDTLFVACTRPSMKWGVPFEGFIVNGVVTCGITVLVIHAPPGFFLGMLIHFLMRELCRVDPHFFHKWHLALRTKGQWMQDYLIFGCSRLQPTPTRTRHHREVRSGV